MSRMERVIPQLNRASNVCFRCSFLCIRNFHTARPLSAMKPKSHPKLALDKRVQEKAQLGGGVRQTYSDEEALPPIALLKAAKKSGAMEMDPEMALTFLRDYMKAARTNITGWEERISQERHTTPEDMTVIASVLRRCPNPPQARLGKALMISASTLGSKAATYQIISTSLQFGGVDAEQSTLRRLALLAKKGGDPQAMFLLGKVLYSQKAEKQALEWLRKATTPPTGSLEFDGAGEALLIEGLILGRGGLDKEGERTAWEKAAKELDEPRAYYYLSQLEGDKGDVDKQQVYLLKAASGGVADAAHNLGMLELEKLMKGEEKKLEKMSDYGMAREWFNVAASSGFGMSMLNMATICETTGNFPEALMWLSKAEKVEDEDVVKQGQLRKTKLEETLGIEISA